MSDKAEVARRVAEVHYQSEAGMNEIYRLLRDDESESEPAEPIKLLEVNASTIPMGVQPLGFDPLPTAGIPYPTIIVEVTPDEFTQIKANKLSLPQGWSLAAISHHSLPMP